MVGLVSAYGRSLSCYLDEVNRKKKTRRPSLCLEFGHFREQEPTARLGELGLLGTERGSPGPKGLKNLAQG
jgi:hypothetical protein